MIICVSDLKEGLNKHKKEFLNRGKFGNFRGDVTADIIRERLQARAALMVEMHAGGRLVKNVFGLKLLMLLGEHCERGNSWSLGDRMNRLQIC